MFLHVGIIHLLLNMVAQVTAGAQLEKEMGGLPLRSSKMALALMFRAAGTLAFLLVYFAGGIFGNVLGGSFSRTGIPSVGASGCLFAVNACFLIDLCLHWKYEDRPKLKVNALLERVPISDELRMSCLGLVSGNRVCYRYRHRIYVSVT